VCCYALCASQDREEILSLLPPLEGRRVLELASGIGRFTPHLAQLVGPKGHVTAVEFISNFHEKNEAAHAHLRNVDFHCADVTTLEVRDGSVDVIFINWLLMYLGDAEVEAFASNALRWLAPGGHIFFRESCLQQSGSKARAFNPTHYRDPEEYTQIFANAGARQAADGEPAAMSAIAFHLERAHSSQTYIKEKGNANQLTWLWQKRLVPAESAAPA